MGSRDGMMRLVVRTIKQETPTILSVELADPDGQALPAWEPGAHIDLQLINRQERQYSLCGNPSDEHTYRVAVKKEDRSRGGSSYIHSYLRPGSAVWVRPPRNHFELKPATRYLLLAAGIGVTPILPMAHQLADREAQWRMIYVNRSRADVAFGSEIAALSPHAEVHLSSVYGRLDLPALLADTQSDEAIYACGPTSFIEELSSLARTLHIEARVHYERFTPKPRSTRPSKPFTVECARSGVSVTVEAGQSMLAALQKEGIPASGSCLSGVCGSCALPLLEGEPDHRDSLTSANDHTVIYPCVSRSITPVLVVDA